MKKQILIVEDDIDLNSSISKFLSIKNFKCVSVYDGQSAIDKAYEEKFMLIILDIKLPLKDGIEVAKSIREFSNIPIVFLTSLNSQVDIENAFSSGADDYIIKPFSLNELHLRINSILKRIYKNTNKIDISPNIIFDIDKLTLLQDNTSIHLTKKETQLLLLFLQHPNKIYSKEEIFDAIYKYDEETNEASLRIFINSLRNIIGKEKIKTIRGIGYKYVSS
jgi:DNA-binding response OmpR family regulator